MADMLRAFPTRMDTRFSPMERERFLLDTLAERRDVERVSSLRAWLAGILGR